jgi:hypothetical protein
VSLSLTEHRTKLPDGGYAVDYLWNGEYVQVKDSAETALTCYQLINSNESDDDIAAGVISAIFVNPERAYLACNYSTSDFGKLTEQVLQDVFGLSPTTSNVEPLWDIEEDAALIRVSIRMAYGFDFDAMKDTVSWPEFVAMIEALPFETPLGFAMYHRNKANRPKRTKYNREEVERFDRLHRELALHKAQTKTIQTQQGAMDDMAAALSRLVK